MDKLVPVDLFDREYVMDKEDHARFEKFAPPKFTIPRLFFLPYEDHFPKAYMDRRLFLAEKAIPLVYEVAPLQRGQLRPTIWLNGTIIGRWEMEWMDKKKNKARVRIVSILEKYKDNEEVASQIKDKRLELENFINEKIAPLTKPAA
jgi:hypothetical protein